MVILHKLYSFKIEDCDMVNIYILYIRSIIEFSCQVWHFAITEEEIYDLERVQKIACNIILNDRYDGYEKALKILNLELLETRRAKLCLKFAKKCVKHNKAKNMFPLNTNKKTKHREKYQVQHASHTRLLNSTIPQLQRALNADALQ